MMSQMAGSGSCGVNDGLFSVPGGNNTEKGFCIFQNL